MASDIAAGHITTPFRPTCEPEPTLIFLRRNSPTDVQGGPADRRRRGGNVVTKRTFAVLIGSISTAVLLATALGQAQAPANTPDPTNAALFTAIDADKDNSVTRTEMKAAFGRWYDAADSAKTGKVSLDQLGPSLNTTLGLQPPPPAAAPAAGGAGRAGGAAPAAPVPGACGGRANLPTVGLTPCASDVERMMAVLPATAPAKPVRARKVLVLGNARGYVHSSIPMAARTIEELGKKTGAWTTTISYDPADINTKNLEQYDALFLSNTTGCFLDGKTAQQPATKEEVEARKAALVAFVRGGKGLAGTHAASDSYRGVCANDQPAGGAARGGGGGRGGNAAGPGGTLANVFLRWSWGLFDQKLQANDQTLTKAEMEAVGDRIYTELDPGQAGRVTREDFANRIVPFVTQTNTYMGSAGRDQGRGSWPDFNTMIGGFFKFHWLDPQEITVKVDDKNSPITKMFGGQDFMVNDEVYTYSVNSFSRKNVRVLTSINYDKMSFLARLKESNPRPDHDFGLSWIKRDGQGRVFFMALGHNERIFGMKPMVEHLLAGMQYALGDLKADDAPSQK
jgi:type 1 glutamine amidotransferase